MPVEVSESGSMRRGKQGDTMCARVCVSVYVSRSVAVCARVRICVRALCELFSLSSLVLVLQQEQMLDIFSLFGCMGLFARPSDLTRRLGRTSNCRSRAKPPQYWFLPLHSVGTSSVVFSLLSKTQMDSSSSFL
jgi:hypothetical protein